MKSGPCCVPSAAIIVCQLWPGRREGIRRNKQQSMATFLVGQSIIRWKCAHLVSLPILFILSTFSWTSISIEGLCRSCSNRQAKRLIWLTFTINDLTLPTWLPKDCVILSSFMNLRSPKYFRSLAGHGFQGEEETQKQRKSEMDDPGTMMIPSFFLCLLLQSNLQT